MAVSLTMSNLSFYEPMRKNWFIVQFDSHLTDITGRDANANNGEQLTIACKTCDIPQLTTEENVIDRINDKVYTPGKSSYNAITMSFNEYINDSNNDKAGNNGHAAGYLLNKWQQEVHSSTTGKQGAKKHIACNAAIVQIDGTGTPVRVWNIYNCWPTEVNFDGLDSADGGTQSVTLTLRYDWAEQTEVAVNVAS